MRLARGQQQRALARVAAGAAQPSDLTNRHLRRPVPFLAGTEAAMVHRDSVRPSRHASPGPARVWRPRTTCWVGWQCGPLWPHWPRLEPAPGLPLPRPPAGRWKGLASGRLRCREQAARRGVCRRWPPWRSTIRHEIGVRFRRSILLPACPAPAPRVLAPEGLRLAHLPSQVAVQPRAVPAFQSPQTFAREAPAGS